MLGQLPAIGPWPIRLRRSGCHGQPRGERHRRRERPRDHRHGQPRLGGEGHLWWHVGGRQSLRCAGPRLGQVELSIDQGVALVRHIGGNDADLAVGDLARRARVLPAHPAGRLALLEKAGLVDHQHRVGGCQRLDGVVSHQIAQDVRVPVAAPQHRLLPPGTGIARGLRPHPARFAPLRAKQPVQEGLRRGSDTRRRKQRSETLLDAP